MDTAKIREGCQQELINTDAGYTHQCEAQRALVHVAEAKRSEVTQVAQPFSQRCLAIAGLALIEPERYLRNAEVREARQYLQ